MLKKVLARLKNIKVLTGVISGVLLILVNFGVIDIEMSDKILTNVNILLGIGVSIGIFGNPETPVIKSK